MSGGMPPCLPVTEEVSAVHTRTRTHTHTHMHTHTHTHAHTHTHTHTPTHTGEILGKRTLVLGACFLAICLASAGVMWGFSLRHKLTRNCDVSCDVCLEVFTIQCVVLILQIVQKEL